MGLLDGRIAKQVARAMKQAKMDKPATLITVTPGVRTAGRTSAGTNPTETSVSCRGLVTTWKRNMLGATIVQVGDRVVMLFGATLGAATPAVGSKITIENITSRVIDVERDPAGATYACLTRA